MSKGLYHIQLGLLNTTSIKRVTVHRDTLTVKNEFVFFCFSTTSRDLTSVYDWWLLLSSDYPSGEISCYPDVKKGIKGTFPHQFRSYPIEGLPFTHGKICLDKQYEALSSYSSTDPIGDSEQRIKWYLNRVVTWFDLALTNQLFRPGDFYELPDYTSEESEQNSIIAYMGDLKLYQEILINYRWGVADLYQFNNNPHVLILYRIRSCKGSLLNGWPKSINDKYQSGISCFWCVLPKGPVLSPWQAPLNWWQMRTVAIADGINFDEMLRSICSKHRDRGLGILLIGFPIPSKVGAEETDFIFIATQLPSISSKILPPKGHQKNEKGFWFHERTKMFHNDKVKYINTQNWHRDRMLARGKILDVLSEKTTLIIGVGALGSIIAELLVRSGMKNIGLIDNDFVEAGNIIRHTLTYNEIGEKKVVALCKKLEDINPNVKVETCDTLFPTELEAASELVSSYDLIIDCSASNDILRTLSEIKTTVPFRFASFSLSIDGIRFFAYLSYSYKLDLDTFITSLNKYKVADNNATFLSEKTLFEGAGCWSPLCPVRYDRIVLISAICINLLEYLSVQNREFGQFNAYEQVFTDGILTGYANVQ